MNSKKRKPDPVNCIAYNKRHSKIQLTSFNAYIRKRLLREISSLFPPENSTLLDIGMGSGRFAYLLGNSVKKYYGIDLQNSILSIAKKNLPLDGNCTLKIGSAEKIPFRRMFDCVLYGFSWHFIQDFNAAFHELDRVTRKESLVFILEPTKSTSFASSPLLFRNSSQFNRDSYQKKIRSIRLAAYAIRNQNMFEVVKKSYVKGSVLYVLKKK